MDKSSPNTWIPSKCTDVYVMCDSAQCSDVLKCTVYSAGLYKMPFITIHKDSQFSMDSCLGNRTPSQTACLIVTKHTSINKYRSVHRMHNFLQNSQLFPVYTIVRTVQSSLLLPSAWEWSDQIGSHVQCQMIDETCLLILNSFA